MRLSFPMTEEARATSTKGVAPFARYAHLLVVCLALRPGVVRAEHAKITLDVSTSTAKQTAHVDQTPPDSGKNPRPVLKANAGETIKVQYLLTNVYPHKTLENMVVHFYVAKQERVGQKEL